MAAEKSPAFQFYPKEFLADGNVAGMTLAELGAYWRLVCVCWNDGSLPMATNRLANMVGVPEREFSRLWPAIRVCFRERDERLIHPRLELEREKQSANRSRQRLKGIEGAKARWARD